MGIWIKTNESKPTEDGGYIVAFLSRYCNARWKWRVDVGYFTLFNGGCWRCGDGHGMEAPDFWMQFPKPPEMTSQEKAESEASFQREKRKRIKNLQKELEELELDLK